MGVETQGAAVGPSEGVAAGDEGPASATVLAGWSVTWRPVSCCATKCPTFPLEIGRNRSEGASMTGVLQVLNMPYVVPLLLGHEEFVSAGVLWRQSWGFMSLPTRT